MSVLVVGCLLLFVVVSCYCALLCLVVCYTLYTCVFVYMFIVFFSLFVRLFVCLFVRWLSASWFSIVCLLGVLFCVVVVV